MRAPVERLVVAATMGPTIHHLHAWRFAVAPGVIELRADPVRFRPSHDPVGRGLRISSGAALVNLRLAAAQLGHAAVVRLLPDAARPSVLASVRLAGRHRTTPEERLLYAATLRPFRTDRAENATAPSGHVLKVLGEAARLEGAALHPLPSTDGACGQRAALTTFGDSPMDWLRVGQALQRVLLSGIVHAVSAEFSFVTHGVHGLEDTTRPGEVPQVVLVLTQQNARLLKPPVGGQYERQGHWERVG
ncbi:hypothetical protein FXF65_10210 [Actinomadura syzygii]|uniref:Nitroreductase domain-containing protein n=1 Tax=Actinomadura syzygii TaxID=1427538 RepID=A0A5D0UEP0_9ACTN|nr:hypothetical protein FXF65_10210 [Actinomadura syzygii]